MSIKKTILILAALLCSIGLKAQDDELLEQIRLVNSGFTSFESDLFNKVDKPSKQFEQEGKLYYIKPGCFAAVFTSGRYMIANDNRLSMNIGKFHGKFRLRKSGMLRSLSNIFLYGFQGRCKDLAEENDYSVKVHETGPYYQITCTNNNRVIFGFGFKQVIFKYFKDSLKLKEIILVEDEDAKSVYTISDVKYDVKIDSKRFEF